MFNVRCATLEDVDAVDALLTRAYPRLLRSDYDAQTLRRSLPFISHAQPDLVSSGTYYLVERNGALLGAGGWTVQRPGTGHTASGVGHVRHVVTDDRAVRQGVARLLLNHIFTTARANKIVRLQCFSTLTAVPFYQAVGFNRLADVMLPLTSDIKFPAVEMDRAL